MTDRLLATHNPNLIALGNQLSNMADKISTLKGVPHKISDGIRVLGSPVDDPSFCKKNIPDMMTKSQEHADTIVDKLESS